MIKRWAKLLVFHAISVTVALLIAGCNIYREIGDLEPETPDAFIVEGHLKLQKSDYEGALADYESALSMDSTKSEAYYGAGKASLLMRHINMFALMRTFQENDPGKIPFLSEPDSVKDVIYTANRAINRYLRPMIRRDTLGLLDGKISASAISADYALATAIEAVLSLADFNGDGRIDSRDDLLSGIIDLSDPSKLNPDSLMRNLADIKNDTAKITALNALLDKSQSLLTESGSAIDLFLGVALGKSDSAAGSVNCAPNDSACIKAKAGMQGPDRDKVGDSAVTQVKQFLQNAGASVVIYKVFDHIDNDGDGCIDEELLDGIDNDGDGLIDEDSRGIPDAVENTRYHAEADGADNDLNGQIDDAGEAQFHLRYEASFEPLALLAQPERKGRIHYKNGEDTRRLVTLMIDSTVTPKLIDSVYTFDLCQGPITGYKYRKSNP